MRLAVQTEIDRPIDEVWRAFTNPANIPRWMPTLSSIDHVAGEPGRPGAMARLVFFENGRSIVMDETVLARRDPNEFVARFDSTHGANVIANKFEPQDDGRTLWTLDSVFTFRGPLKLLMFFFKGVIHKRLRDDCNRFKEKLEAGKLET